MNEFVSKFIHSLVVFDMNVIGLLAGFLGGILITFFGLPSIGVLNQGMYSEIETTKTMRIYSWFSRIGLFLVMVGFLLQLLPAVQSVK